MELEASLFIAVQVLVAILFLLLYIKLRVGLQTEGLCLLKNAMGFMALSQVLPFVYGWSAAILRIDMPLLLATIVSAVVMYLPVIFALYYFYKMYQYFVKNT